VNAPRSRAVAVALGLAFTLGVAGCYEAPQDDPPPPSPPETVDQTVGGPPEPEFPRVPEVTGDLADAAQTTIEAEGFTVTFDPDEPGDPSVCTVDDQDVIGEAEERTSVNLTISCEVPDVTGMDGASAIDELETANFTWHLDACDDDPGACTVADQDPLEAQPGDEISLTMELDGGEGSECHESYPSACLDPGVSDYDCEGGTGNGPNYVPAPIDVDHAVADPDPFDLDRDGDGTGCDDY
jgi:beta-lactam-binding protein with PASTA domain